MTPAPDALHEASVEAPEEGATHLLDAVAAADYLRRGLRHGFTIWDALEEALRWWLEEHRTLVDGANGDDQAHLGETDPLRDRIDQVLAHLTESPEPKLLSDVLQQALRRWAETMASRFNAGQHWPHPGPRRGFPPPAIAPAEPGR
jgi:hypothetical protein